MSRRLFHTAIAVALVALLVGSSIRAMPVQAGPAADQIAVLEARVDAQDVLIADLRARVTALEVSPSPSASTSSSPQPTSSSTASPTPSVVPSSTPSSTPTASPTPTAGPTPTPPPTPTPTPVVTPPPGSSLPTVDPQGWRRIYATDFPGTVAEGQFPGAFAPNLGAYPLGWTDTSKNGRYDPGIISVHDGVMDLFVRTTNGVHRVAAPTVTPNGVSNYLSGRYEIRFKIDSMRGYKTAWLLWPQSNTWPRDGEIDFPERNLDSTSVSAFMHRQGATAGSDQFGVTVPYSISGWHTAVIEWKAGVSCEFFLDGASIGRTTTRVPNTPMHWVIQTETQLSGGAPADSVQGHVLIDYLVMWVPS